MKSQYVDTKKLEIELYQRFTVPMASLMFALIGAPLGIRQIVVLLLSVLV